MEQFVLDIQSLYPIIISTSIIYIFIFLGLRIFAKRGVAQLSITDFVVMLLLSEAAQNAMVGSNVTVAGGITAISTLLLWDYVLKKLEYKFPRFEKLIEGEPLILVSKGHIYDKNMQKIELSMNELMESIRKEGIEKLEDVKLAMMETDGEISIIKI